MILSTGDLRPGEVAEYLLCTSSVGIGEQNQESLYGTVPPHLVAYGQVLAHPKDLVTVSQHSLGQGFP